MKVEDIGNKFANPKNGFLTPQLIGPQEFSRIKQDAESSLSNKVFAVNEVTAYQDTVAISHLYDPVTRYLVFLVHFPLDDASVVVANTTAMEEDAISQLSFWGSVHQEIAINMPKFFKSAWYWTCFILGMIILPRALEIFGVWAFWKVVRWYQNRGQQQVEEPQHQEQQQQKVFAIPPGPGHRDNYDDPPIEDDDELIQMVEPPNNRYY